MKNQKQIDKTRIPEVRLQLQSLEDRIGASVHALKSIEVARRSFSTIDYVEEHYPRKGETLSRTAED
jgi:hypothetical protein